MRRYIALLALLLLAAGCGGADDPLDTAVDALPTATATAPDAPGDADGDAVTVTGVDYAFQDVPDSVTVGTTLQFTNASDLEVHELVLVQLPEAEDRGVGDLLQMPQEELMGMLMPAVVGVSVAPPGQDGTVVEGELTVPTAGRYALLCFVPTGADPEEFMAAAAESEGPPDVEGGAPHVANGMFAELTVTQ